MTQNERVRDWLEAGKTLTSLEAVDFLAITRLAARISDLKKEGMAIRSTMVDVRNRFGERCSVSEYKLITDITQGVMAL